MKIQINNEETLNFCLFLFILLFKTLFFKIKFPIDL